MGTYHFSFSTARLTALLSLAAVVAYAAGKADSSKATSGNPEFTVSETFEKKFAPVKPHRVMDVPMEQVLPPFHAIPSLNNGDSGEQNPELERLLLMGIGVPTTDQTAKPWLPDIPGPMLARFQLQVPKDSKVKSWKLQIFDAQGILVSQLEKTGRPPEVVEWDGKTVSDQPVKVGGNYTYRLLVTDPLGRTNTFLGNTFQLPAMQYQSEHSLIIEIDVDRLFSPRQSTLLPTGKDLLERTLQTVVEQGAAGYKMALYDDSLGALAKDRILALKRHISPSVQLSQEEIPLDVLPPSGRGRVLQVAINR